VCAAYNADFDGDQMAVHVPLSVEAQIEARVLMMSTNNILSPATGRPIIGPTQDIVLGCYYMTRERPGVRGEGMRFSNPDEVRVAYDAGELELHAAIKVRIEKDLRDEESGETRRVRELVDTTTGRVLLREIVPGEIPFDIRTIKVFEYDLSQPDQSREIISRVLSRTLEHNRLDSPVRQALRAKWGGQHPDAPAPGAPSGGRGPVATAGGTSVTTVEPVVSAGQSKVIVTVNVQ